MCNSRIFCTETTCLPYCTSFNDESSAIPENCVVWSDGCNMCDTQEVVTEYKDVNGLEFSVTRYKLDNGLCSLEPEEERCASPEEPTCMDYADCVVPYGQSQPPDLDPEPGLD